MQFGQVIENNKRNIFKKKNHAKNEAGSLVPYLLLFSEIALYEVKAGGLQLTFNIFG